jgi:pullulanase-type alpha-1,6-glucosidase
MTVEEKRLFEKAPVEIGQRCNLELAQAYWVSRDTILWRVTGSPAFSYSLHHSPSGRLKVEGNEITGGHKLPLQYEPGGASLPVLEKFPHLSGSTALKLRDASLESVPDLLKEQTAVSAFNEHGHLVWTTLLQIPGVLDDLYTYTGKLGVSYEGDAPVLRLWAPTARRVWLHLYPNSTAPEAADPIGMRLDPASGVWVAYGKPDWTGRFYLYEVEVYVPRMCRVEKNLVTDPYSVSLSTNSKRSQIVELNHPGLMPKGWTGLKKPHLEHFANLVVYELHVRDFSIRDRSVSPAYRGTYKAFTEMKSSGMRHLKSLAQAGLTHIHLLPVFDFASVNEKKEEWEQPAEELLRSFPPDSSEQQKLVSRTRDRDGFNWGYDPFHFTVPEGSYATDPDGSVRILEFREMVSALNAAGLRVIMDVVYNHTFASGQDEKSVLDKIVPGYYHRLNAEGFVENSTCCANTATEHAMMEKLMIDSLITWATAYKIDGFRFDLMGHHMLSNLLHVRQALDELTLGKDGVEGRKIYLYGEGWDFGEVGGGARGLNATQFNIGGTGIGAFNDRMRDAVRGGRPFGGIQEQGFITGLFTDPNPTDQGDLEQQKWRLLHSTDWIRLGLAGNLKSYRLVNANGHQVSGWEIEFNGRPAAYAQQPHENVVYVSAHDNETLFDAIQLKASPAASLRDRIRMHCLGLSLVIFSQGVSFFLAGDDLLRTKSLDRNSYNSGDWYNALDFTGETSSWGIGLPPGENEFHWPVMAPLLANPGLKPGKEQILRTAAYFREILRIRKSSHLFRLRTAEEIAACIRFHNIGPEQIPGFLVLELTGADNPHPQDEFQRVVVVFNAQPGEQVYTVDSLKGAPLVLHPVLAASVDPPVRRSRFNSYTGTLIVPGRTTAVFVAGRPTLGVGFIEWVRKKLAQWFPQAKDQ